MLSKAQIVAPCSYLGLEHLVHFLWVFPVLSRRTFHPPLESPRNQTTKQTTIWISLGNHKKCIAEIRSNFETNLRFINSSTYLDGQTKTRNKGVAVTKFQGWRRRQSKLVSFQTNKVYDPRKRGFLVQVFLFFFFLMIFA